jgi:hypothetical protein
MKKTALLAALLFRVILYAGARDSGGENITLEISNIPPEFDGKHCLVAAAEGQNAYPRVERGITGTVFSGEFTYRDGAPWKTADAEKNTRYTFILIINSGAVAKFSRRFLIESNTVRLDYHLDFFDTPEEALPRYSPPRDRLPQNRLWNVDPGE